MLPGAMVVQVRRNVFRVIRQHDHALASGALAGEWIGTGNAPEPLPLEVVLAAALHDCGWRDADAVPRRDPGADGVLGFLEHPREQRVRFYPAGIDEVERVHPYAGLLASLHYGRLPRDESTAAFLEAETERRQRLARELDLDDEGLARLERHRRFVTLFDDLSLYACLAAPGSQTRPDWLLPDEVAATPDGEPLRLRWLAPDTIEVGPFPFRRTVELAIPARDLPRRRYEDDASVRRAWNVARPIVHRVRFVTGSLESGAPPVLR